jgi:hypothetical protein
MRARTRTSYGYTPNKPHSAPGDKPMNRAVEVSSLVTSLRSIDRLARQRVGEDRDQQARRTRHAGIKRMVSDRRKRRIDGARSKRQLEKQRAEHVLRLEENVRREAIAEATSLKARIEAKHESSMREVALRHSFELELRRAELGDRSTRLRHALRLCIIAWLTTLAFGAMAWSQPSKHTLAQSSLQGIAYASSELSLLADHAEQRIAASTAAATKLNIARAEREAPPPPRTVAPRWRARPTPPKPFISKPEPVAADLRQGACDDTSGDPCCAFGAIMC